MSANLLDGLTPQLNNGTAEDGGTWHVKQVAGKADLLTWKISGQAALAANQTVHLGLSAKAASGSTGTFSLVVAYMDAAGKKNWAWGSEMSPTASWSRFEASATIPSGMTIYAITLSIPTGKKSPESWVANPVFSYGSPVPLASSAHTPYATQDHLAAEYATKAALKVTSDAVTAEVTERGKLAGRVGTLESTTGTHASRLEQLASSIRSLVKGESTYTDPDGKSATSGIYSLVTQTRDSVTALFGQYTKTADLASTQAVKDAKKAGTDAQAAASAAQTTADSAKSTAQAAASDAATAKTNAASAVSTANSASTSAANAVETANAASSTASSASSTANSAASTANAAKTSAASAVSTANSANSTANTAKSTADSLATMIREDATGITVGKSADGKTYSTGRTRMTADAFEVLSNAGEVLSSFGKDKVRLGVDGAQIDMAGGRLLIDAQDHAASEMPSGLPTTITRMICPSSNSGKNDTEMYLGAYDKDSGNVVGGMGITVTRETDGSYNTSVGISGSLSLGSATLATPLPVSSGGTGATSIDAARRNLHISQGSKVCHGHGTPWVTLFESWDEFRQATGCYDSDTPTLVTMNGDWSAFDGALSGCEVQGGKAVYVLAQTTSGLPNISSSQSLRINWICIW